MSDNVEYSKVFYQNDAKDFQWRLTVSEFRGVQYLNIRKYFLTFEEDYQPTKDGMSIPLELASTFSLAAGLLDILSHAEATELKSQLLEHENRINSEISG